MYLIEKQMEAPLKTGILGLDEQGRFLLEATRDNDNFKIVAVADSNANLAQQFGKLWKCVFYDDYRQLITQNQLDCLFVAAPMHTCAEFLKMAIKKKFNIFKLPPVARNYGEAAELAKLAQAEGVTLAIANLNRFARPALAMRNFILQNPKEQFFFILAGATGRKFTAENAPLRCATPGHAETAEESVARASSPCRHGQDGRATYAFSSAPAVQWRGDPVLSGGGVLLYDCWEIIEQIVQNFGVPQQVYCVAGSTAADSRQRQYLTEDSAVITMKFNDMLCCTLLAGRAADSFTQASQNRLIAQGQNMVLRVDGKSFEVTDNRGERLKREDFEVDELDELKKAVENFGAHLLWPDKNPLICSVADNLKNMAVIEAAYLSARTGMPEQPEKILEIS
jgi:predicted dehydrogenase